MPLAEPALLPVDRPYVICVFTVSKLFCIIEAVSILCNIKIKNEKPTSFLCWLGVNLMSLFIIFKILQCSDVLMYQKLHK